MLRPDGDHPSMGLTSWKGEKVHKEDIIVSKNYLSHDELNSLNRLVTMFLDFAEDRAIRREQIKMEDWVSQTDKFLRFNERDVLSGAGALSHNTMVTITDREYEKFKEARKRLEKELSDDEFSKDIEVLSKKGKK